MLEEPVVVGDTALKFPRVDEVKGAGIHPFGLVVVDFKQAVWWDPVLSAWR